MSGVGARLKPKYADGTKQSQQGADLKLPLAQDVALFRKENEREQRGHNYRRASEDGVNAGTDIKKCNRLSDLMDNVWNRRNQTKDEGAKIEARCGAANAEGDEGRDGNTGNAIAIEILRPNIVIAQQIKLEKGWQRPNDNRSEKCQVASRNAALGAWLAMCDRG